MKCGKSQGFGFRVFKEGNKKAKDCLRDASKCDVLTFDSIRKNFEVLGGKFASRQKLKTFHYG